MQHVFNVAAEAEYVCCKEYHDQEGWSVLFAVYVSYDLL